MRNDRAPAIDPYDAIQLLSDQTLYLNAMNSMRRYSDSKGRLAEDDVESLRLEAESQFARLQLFYLEKLGR